MNRAAFKKGLQTLRTPSAQSAQFIEVSAQLVAQAKLGYEIQ
jgi:hypothetical protein